MNGVLVDGPFSPTGDLNDWDGGDTAELGWGENLPGYHPNPNNPNPPFNPVDFTGDIALFNYYDSALSRSQVEYAYSAVVPDGGSTIAVLGLVTAAFAFLRRKLR